MLHLGRFVMFDRRHGLLTGSMPGLDHGSLRRRPLSPLVVMTMAVMVVGATRLVLLLRWAMELTDGVAK